MPEVQENANRNRLKEVRKRTISAARLWLDMYVAASNGDIDGCKGIYKHIREATVEAADLLKAMEGEAS